jgi:hypothetical protein
METGPDFDPQPTVLSGGSPVSSQDEEHLRILQIGYWIYAALNALGTCCVGGYFGLFSALFSTAASVDPKQGPAIVFGGLFVMIGVILVLLMGGLAYLHYAAGRAIQSRSGTTVVYVSAALACLSFPIGTALGVFTFIVMSRPSVKALFSS